MKPTKAELGVGFSDDNSRRLLADSKILLENKSYGHAVASAVLALEEFAKKIILVAVKLGFTEMDAELRKILFRDHGSKIWISLQALAHAKGFETTPEILEYLRWATPRLQSLKERGLYADYIKGGWHSPLDQDMEKIAASFISESEEILQALQNWSKEIPKKMQ